MSVLTFRATGSAAVAMEVNPARPFQLEGMKIHLSAAGGAGNLTITLDSGVGAAYDAVLLTQDMTSVVDYLWVPTRPIKCTHASDHLDIVWANANSKTYGIECNVSPI